MRVCDATNVRGERCRQEVSVTIELAGVRRRFCTAHAAGVRRGTVRLWVERRLVEPGPPRYGEPWTEEDDAVVADPNVTSSEAAMRLGRTTAAVQIRRSLKRRGLV